MRQSLAVAALVIAGILTLEAPVASQQIRPASASDVQVPLSDARKAGANSVRFSAAQFTDTAPVVVLFGATDDTWAMVRAGVQQAVFEGYPVKMVFIGPVTEPPGLEIYAKGQHVTNPIDPKRMSAGELTKLLRDVHRQYYGR